ncbi:MAG: ABC transporter permease [Candidatus Sericytochromatia bacterium]|nr:ABC transporter permease [Candidatus Sericytochromatia bacterium]
MPTKIEAAGLRPWIRQSMPLVALLLLMGLFSLLSARFLSFENLGNIAVQSSHIGLIAVGMTFVIATGGIDLSVGSVLALSICAAGLTMAPAESGGAGQGVLAGWGAGLLTGALAGGVNGLLISRLKLSPFIATLGMMSVARGVANVLTDGMPVEDIPEGALALGTGDLAGMPWAVLLWVAAALLGGLVLGWTRLGRYACALGSNEEALRLSGVRPGPWKGSLYVLSGLLSAAAGLVFLGRVSNAQPSAGVGFELDAIAAVVIGGASLMGGRGSMAGTVVGVALMGVLRNGLVLLDVSAFWQQLVIGVVVVLAVLLDRWRTN